MTGLTALLLFAAWTLLLMFIYAGYRIVLVLTMQKRADAWGRDLPNVDPPVIKRIQHAHLNCVENLPVFGAIVLTAVFVGKSAVVDTLGAWVLYLRIAQSLVHIAGASHWFVFVRANLFVLQILLFFWMIWGLLI